MKILIIADPYIPVPPQGYGGIERVINMLIKEYIKQGHKVTLVAHPHSKAECEVIPYGIPPHKGALARIGEVLQLWKILLAKRKEADIIHSFGRLAGMLPMYFSKIPKIQSYQRKVVKKNPWLAVKLAGDSIFFTACSDSCAAYGGISGRWLTIHNGSPLDVFKFQADARDGAPLVFLGRLDEDKGAHVAIEVALAVGKRLVIAGNIIKEGAAYWYYKEKVAPNIDGININYIGEIDDAGKNDLLGNALCLLMPVGYDDPCPVVVSEALACGTPVIGFKRGGLPEMIQDGVNGFLCENELDMIDRVKRIKEISRQKCRDSFEKNLSVEVIAGKYLDLYKKLVFKQ